MWPRKSDARAVRALAQRRGHPAAGGGASSRPSLGISGIETAGEAAGGREAAVSEAATLEGRRGERGEGSVGTVLVLVLAVLVAIASMYAFGFRVDELWEGTDKAMKKFGLKAKGESEEGVKVEDEDP